jgi:glycerol-3-phosphate dehydrogenase (NAD(P)+)
MNSKRVSIIGAGAMGAALGLNFDRASHETSLCATALDAHLVRAIEGGEVHPGLGQRLPKSISVVPWGEWKEGLPHAELVVLAVASSGIRAVVREAHPLLSPGAVWVIATKGWDSDTAEPLSRVVEIDSPGHPVVIMVGPSLATEMASGTLTGFVCAGRDLNAARLVADAVRSSSVRTYVTDDVVGVEVGSALKNVLAIAIGMCDGIEEEKGRPMTNAKAALFSRGLIEMALLARALGGRVETVLGLAGAGDLFVTVLGGRNGRFGRLVGAGLEPRKALDEMATTVEGFANADEAVKLAEKHSLDLPVARMVHSVLYLKLDPEEAISSILLGPVETEFEG